MKNAKSLTALSISLIVLCIIIYNTAFAGGRPTCNHYIFNVYMYLFLAILISMLSYIISTENKTELNKLSKTNILFNVVVILLLFGSLILTTTFKENQLLSHLFFLIFVALNGFIMFYSLQNVDKKLILEALIQCSVAMVVLSLVVFMYPEYIKSEWGYLLFLLLIILIVAQLVTTLIIGPLDPKYKLYQKLFAYFGIVIFSAFVLVDTKVILERSKSCVVPSYPSASLELFLDALNIFTELVEIKQ